MYSENSIRQAVLQADSAVVAAMTGYLRTSRSGGMPRKLSDSIANAVEHAAALGLFSLAIAEAAKALDQPQDKK